MIEFASPLGTRDMVICVDPKLMGAYFELTKGDPKGVHLMSVFTDV